MPAMIPTTSMSPKTPRRWFQFRLRTLLMFVAIVAVPCGWLGWKLELKRKERAVLSEVNRLGGTVLFDWQGPYPCFILESTSTASS
jgi:hypothetical protein